MFTPKTFLLALFLVLALPGCSSKTVLLTDPADTVATWNMARYYQAEGRYELARQYYGLALSTARSQDAVNQLQRELFGVELQLQTLR